MSIGEYSARKNLFFPSQQKNCEKISPYFSLSEVENCPKLHFFKDLDLKKERFFGRRKKKSARMPMKFPWSFGPDSLFLCPIP